MTHPGRRKSYSKALAVLTLVLIAHFFLQAVADVYEMRVLWSRGVTHGRGMLRSQFYCPIQRRVTNWGDHRVPLPCGCYGGKWRRNLQQTREQS